MRHEALCVKALKHHLAADVIARSLSENCGATGDLELFEAGMMGASTVVSSFWVSCLRFEMN